MAIILGVQIIFHRCRLYHLRRSTLSQLSRGRPSHLRTLKDIWRIQLTLL